MAFSNQFVCSHPGELDTLSADILKQYADRRFFAISGPMGAGKTTFIKSLCKNLQVIDNVSSPTFSIVNEYRTESGARIYHFDMYRIKSPEELFDIGYEEYFYSGNYCFLEWPELVQNILPLEIIEIKIEVSPTGSERIFTVSELLPKV